MLSDYCDSSTARPADITALTESWRPTPVQFSHLKALICLNLILYMPVLIKADELVTRTISCCFMKLTLCPGSWQPT